jgi:DNA-binding CsgD family transcriptional regulator
MLKRLLILLFLINDWPGPHVGWAQTAASSSSAALLRQGWAALVEDHDTAAVRAFGAARTAARREHNPENEAAALLNLGIASYGASLTNGLTYATQALAAYSRLADANQSRGGRSKCLQLLATIYGRQGKYRAAIRLSREALTGFPEPDTTTYRGLIFASLGTSYDRLGLPDSAAVFQRAALAERLRGAQVVYLPGSYIAVADLHVRAGQPEPAARYYHRALALADSTGNRQAQVAAWLGLARWDARFGAPDSAVTRTLARAETLARTLADQTFLVNVLSQRVIHSTQINDYRAALAAQQEVQHIRDSLAGTEQHRIADQLAVQFEVAEKDRQLRLAAREQEVARLTNYLLWGAVAVLLLGTAGLTLFFQRMKARDRQLLQAKEALLAAQAEQKRLREEQLRNEIEYRESQLTALALQMRQKSELMGELKERLEAQPTPTADPGLARLLNRGANQDKEWADFNAHFESLNRNFYARLRQKYPDISPGELKICALIKLNLSVKEMAGILNISPDSVKTARYRLRKKLQLATEDNLTDFVLNIT